MDRDDIIDQLNSFLRGEISAVESYRMAIDRVKSGNAREDLARCLDSHEERVDRIRAKVMELGGKPAEGAGAWGAWVKLMQGSADLFGDRAAVAALEEGEDHGRDDYRRGIDKLGDKIAEPQAMRDIGSPINAPAGSPPMSSATTGVGGMSDFDTVQGVSGADIGVASSTTPFRAEGLRAFAERLLAEQLETHRTMSALKKILAEGTGEARPIV